MAHIDRIAPVDIGWSGRRSRSRSERDVIVRDESPLQLETALHALGASEVTPNDLFFVRSHHPEPVIDPIRWRLEVAGSVHRPLQLPLGRLQGQRLVEGAHTLECAGNGRSLYADDPPGVAWTYGAVGTALWGGIRLRDVLLQAGLKPEARHVWFEGGDIPRAGDAPFVRSIPLEKAMDDTMLACFMNGQPLPALHGAPVRVIVPGWYGMASVKWVTRIRVESAPCDGPWMTKAYRYVYPTAERASMAVDETRVKSVITHPLDGTRVPRGFTNVRGFAWGGAANVRGVDVSIDGSHSWRLANFSSPTLPQAWRRWEAGFHLLEPGRFVIMARATDAWGASQPPSARPNAQGYGNNSIQRVTVDVI